MVYSNGVSLFGKYSKESLYLIIFKQSPHVAYFKEILFDKIKRSPHLWNIPRDSYWCAIKECSYSAHSGVFLHSSAARPPNKRVTF